VVRISVDSGWTPSARHSKTVTNKSGTVSAHRETIFIMASLLDNVGEGIMFSGCPLAQSGCRDQARGVLIKWGSVSPLQKWRFGPHPPEITPMGVGLWAVRPPPSFVRLDRSCYHDISRTPRTNL